MHLEKVEAKTTEKQADGTKVQKVVATGEANLFDTVKEAREKLGEERTLSIINTQIKIRTLDALRKGTSPTAQINAALKNASPEVLEQAKKLLGLV